MTSFGETRDSEPSASRRAVLGAAWAAPVLIAASATPAFAASPDVPVLLLLITAVDNDGYTAVVRIEHSDFEVWRGANFEFQMLDDEFQEWIPVAFAITDNNGDWSTRIAYQDVPPGYSQARILFRTDDVDYTSTPVRLPPPPPTITTTVMQDVSDTWDIITQVTPRLSGTSVTPYEIQGKDSGGTWTYLTGGVTNASGAGIINVPGFNGAVAIRTHVVINTFNFYSDEVPV